MCELGETIMDLKLKIEDSEFLPPNCLRLVYLRKQLDDNRTLADCGIEKNSTLHLVMLLRAGGTSLQTIEPLLHSDSLMYQSGSLLIQTEFFAAASRWRMAHQSLNVEGRSLQTNGD